MTIRSVSEPKSRAGSRRNGANAGADSVSRKRREYSRMSLRFSGEGSANLGTVRKGDDREAVLR